MTGEIAKYRLPALQATIVDNISRGLAHYEARRSIIKSVLAVILKIRKCQIGQYILPRLRQWT